MSTLRDAVYGAAVGDALGVPFEFRGRDTFACTDMVGRGTYGLPAGTFSDDTSMMLATCDSIRELGRIDVDDMRERFRSWWLRGVYTADGACFDIGNTTAMALDAGCGRAGERDNGNGSLMRIAPLAFCDASDDDVRAVSAITHAHRISTESCVCFVSILRAAARGDIVDAATLEAAIHQAKPAAGAEHDAFAGDTARGTSAADTFAFLDDVLSWSRDEVRSGGYVIDTLGAALWCFAHTDTYADCVLAAVNLGGDTDTTACVAGALAGAVYGYDAIPADWLVALRGKDVIESCLF